MDATSKAEAEAGAARPDPPAFCAANPYESTTNGIGFTNSDDELTATDNTTTVVPPRRGKLPPAAHPRPAAAAAAKATAAHSVPSGLHQELIEAKAIQEGPVPQNLIRVPMSPSLLAGPASAPALAASDSSDTGATNSDEILFTNSDEPTVTDNLTTEVVPPRWAELPPAVCPPAAAAAAPGTAALNAPSALHQELVKAKVIQGSLFDEPHIWPDFALSGILGYLSFSECSRLLSLSKGWLHRLREEGEAVWKEQLVTSGLVGDDGRLPDPPLKNFPKYFVVSNRGGLGMENIARLLGVDRCQLTITEGLWQAENGPLAVGTVLKVDYHQEVVARKVRTGRRRRDKGRRRRRREKVDKAPSGIWWQCQKVYYLTECLLRHLQQCKVDTVWTAHGFDYKRISDLAPLPATVVNGVYHYDGDVRSRSKAGWLADRYLRHFKVDETLSTYRGRVLRSVSGRGRCLGSTKASGWYMLGQNKERVRQVLESVTEEETYGLRCVNNRTSDGVDYHYDDDKYIASIRLLLDMFFGAAEPGAVFLFASHILELDTNGEEDEDDNDKQEYCEVVETSEEEDHFEYRDAMRDYYDSYGANTDTMIVAIGRSHVMSFYCYLIRYWW